LLLFFGVPPIFHKAWSCALYYFSFIPHIIPGRCFTRPSDPLRSLAFFLRGLRLPPRAWVRVVRRDYVKYFPNFMVLSRVDSQSRPRRFFHWSSEVTSIPLYVFLFPLIVEQFHLAHNCNIPCCKAVHPRLARIRLFNFEVPTPPPFHLPPPIFFSPASAKKKAGSREKLRPP